MNHVTACSRCGWTTYGREQLAWNVAVEFRDSPQGQDFLERLTRPSLACCHACHRGLGTFGISTPLASA